MIAVPARKDITMTDATRRGFLIMAGAGAAAVGVAAVAPAAGEATQTITRLRGASTASSPLVAYVRDARKGDVSVMVGEREVVVHDPELVARLIRAGR
jgi:hypothetical protein